MLSPKQIGTICFAIFSILISAPLFATDIPSSASTADCKNNPLDTYSGTSNLQADWEANTIDLHWYDGDTELTVAEESQTCTYDGTLTPPSTIPTKTGYTFTGWRVRPPVCSFTASEVNGMSGVAYGYTRLNGSAGYREAEFGLTTPGEWATKFNTGIIKGIAKCSSTRAGYATPGTPSDMDGGYCWCRATNYTPNGGNQCNVASPSWVSYSDVVYADDCVHSCASRCAFRVQSEAPFRRPVFGAQ